MRYQIVEELSREECYAFLRKSHTGRVGVSSNALPSILPVNFALVDDTVVFSAQATGELFRATVGSVIAFEVDANSRRDCFEWSVLVQGIAQEINRERLSNRMQAMQLNLGKSNNDSDRFVVIPTTIISGRRFV